MDTDANFVKKRQLTELWDQKCAAMGVAGGGRGWLCLQALALSLVIRRRPWFIVLPPRRELEEMEEEEEVEERAQSRS